MTDISHNPQLDGLLAYYELLFAFGRLHKDKTPQQRAQLAVSEGLMSQTDAMRILAITQNPHPSDQPQEETYP